MKIIIIKNVNYSIKIYIKNDLKMNIFKNYIFINVL